MIRQRKAAEKSTPESFAKDESSMAPKQTTPEFGLQDGCGTDPLTESEFEFLQQALQIHRKDRGCETPIEDFLTKLIRHHSIFPLDIEDIESDLEECRRDFDDAIKTAAEVVMDYADRVRDQLPSGWQLTLRNLAAVGTDVRGMNRSQLREVVR